MSPYRWVSHLCMEWNRLLWWHFGHIYKGWSNKWIVYEWEPNYYLIKEITNHKTENWNESSGCFYFFIYTDTKKIDECGDKYKYETMFVIILIIIYSVVSFAETYGSHIAPAVLCLESGQAFEIGFPFQPGCCWTMGASRAVVGKLSSELAAPCCSRKPGSAWRRMWMVESIFNNETTQKCHLSVTSLRDVIECGRVVSRVCSGRSMFGVWDLFCI